ncbi:MAG: hypothetical protein Q9223_002357 [Gallowayella weberi]
MHMLAPTRCPLLLQYHFSPRSLRSPFLYCLGTTRTASSNASFPSKSLPILPTPHPEPKAPATSPHALARLPTSSILRSLCLGAFFSSSVLFTPGFALLKKISSSPSRLLNPDANPILRAILRPLVYDQFCAGRGRGEIQAKIGQIRSLGFAGVVLCYGKERPVQRASRRQRNRLGDLDERAVDEELEWWKRGNLETLDMLSHGDFLGIKYSVPSPFFSRILHSDLRALCRLSGCGARITADLIQGNPPPSSFTAAMDAIVQTSISKNVRIWIDSEQQALQPSIDDWAINLMRQYNRGDGKTVVYNTLQAYLKSARAKLKRQAQLAHREGWTLAIKLVRGAYIDSDIRDRIWDTKQQTDDSYNGIVRDLLTGTNVAGVPSGPEFPKMHLFLAGHNRESVQRASDLVRKLQLEGKLATLPEFGQLQGMADQLSCELLRQGEEMLAKGTAAASNTAMRDTVPMQAALMVPKVYKCLTWGSIQECMQYLVRRAVENRGGTGAVKEGMPALVRELMRRFGDVLMGRRRLGR